MNKQELTELLQTTFPQADITISGENCSLTVQVIDDSFIGQSRVKRQQMVSRVLADKIKSGQIHALSIIAKPKEEL